MNHKERQSNGFTLVEVLVASSIGAFITVVAMGALTALSGSSARVQDHCDRVSEMRYAASVIARDLRNLYRDTDRNATKFVSVFSPEGGEQHLVFYTVSHDVARNGQPESDVYEVEYYVKETDEQYYLMRRWWPNPNKDVDPGGLLTMLTQGVVGFQARFFDGREWQTEWSERSETPPSVVEVGLVFKPQGDETPQIERVLVYTRPRAGQPTMSSNDRSGLTEGPEWNVNDSDMMEGQ